MLSLALLLSTSLILAPPSPSLASLRLVELTGDGLADKLLIDADGRLSVAVNRGAGHFELIAQPLPSVALQHVLVTDLDGDGHADLYLTSPGDNLALLGHGDGRFFDATGELGLADRGAGVSAERMDLDGTGAAELVLHNEGTDVIFWATPRGFARDSSTPAVMPGAPSKAASAAELEEILSHFSLAWLDDGYGELRKTIRITGTNLQLVNGLRATNGYPPDVLSLDENLTSTNGLGNLIIGYDEPFPFGKNDRTGSHNLVIGKSHTYTSFGGLIAGDSNSVLAPYSTVAGGFGGVAGGLRSSVLGGELCEALGYTSSVLGGGYNVAEGMYATISGGAYNEVPGNYAHICSGESNVAVGATSCVVSGSQMVSTGVGSTALGGSFGDAGGFASVVMGGEFNRADGDTSVVVGGSDNLAAPGGASRTGVGAVVVGGRFGVASGDFSTVLAGGGAVASEGNLAIGDYSSVGGGRDNTATGTASSVSGGNGRSASGTDDWAAGSLAEDS